MGGNDRAGGQGHHTQQSQQGEQGEQGEQGRRTDTATETAGSRRASKRTAKTGKSASSKSGTVADKNSRRKESQRGGARSTASGSASATATGARATSADLAGLLPVRDDEEQWSPEELAEVRGELEQEIAGLRQEIDRAESEIADRLADPSDGAGDDQADTGAKTFEREHEMSLANNARDLLGQNERAIGRMEAGTYGVCETCGNPIGKARLQAFPRAALCVTCKQREERR